MTVPALDRSRRNRKIRRWCGIGIICAAVPYLTLKILWVAGVMVGVPEESAARSGWEVQNAATGVLDLVAILLALGLMQRWGQRVPAWLVIVPIWVGTGFLVPAFIEVLIDFGYAIVTSGRLVNVDSGLVDNWTYAVVGSGFAIQGILLSIAFVLYVYERWRDTVADVDVEPPRTPTFPIQRVVGITGAVFAAFVAVVHAWQAVLAPPAWRVGEWTFETRVVEGVEAVGALLAVVGITQLLRARAGRWVPPTRKPGRFNLVVVLTWLGSGSLFSYGFFRTLSYILAAPLSETVTVINRTVGLASLLSGLVLGLMAIVLLVERRHAVRAVEWDRAEQDWAEQDYPARENAER